MKLVILAAVLAVCGAAKLEKRFIFPVKTNTAVSATRSSLSPFSHSIPLGGYTNDGQGVVVDAVAPGTRTSGVEPTGLGAPRTAYGSTNSKVGDAAFAAGVTAFNAGDTAVKTFFPGFGSSGETASKIGIGYGSYGVKGGNTGSLGLGSIGGFGFGNTGGLGYGIKSGTKSGVAVKKPEINNIESNQIVKTFEKITKEKTTVIVVDGTNEAQKHSVADTHTSKSSEAVTIGSSLINQVQSNSATTSITSVTPELTGHDIGLGVKEQAEGQFKQKISGQGLFDVKPHLGADIVSTSHAQSYGEKVFKTENFGVVGKNQAEGQLKTEISGQGQFEVKPQVGVDTISASHSQGYGGKLFGKDKIGVSVKEKAEGQLKTEFSGQGQFGIKPQLGVDTISASHPQGYGAKIFENENIGVSVKDQSEGQLKTDISGQSQFGVKSQLGVDTVSTSHAQGYGGKLIGNDNIGVSFKDQSEGQLKTDISGQSQFGVKPQLGVDTISASHAQGYGGKLIGNDNIDVAVKDKAEVKLQTEISDQDQFGIKPQLGVDTNSASHAQSCGGHIFGNENIGVGVKDQAEGQLKTVISDQGQFDIKPQLGDDTIGASYAQGYGAKFSENENIGVGVKDQSEGQSKTDISGQTQIGVKPQLEVDTISASHAQGYGGKLIGNDNIDVAVKDSDQDQFGVKPQVGVDTTSTSHSQGYGGEIFGNKNIGESVKDQAEGQLKTDISGQSQFGIKSKLEVDQGYSEKFSENKDISLDVKDEAERQLKTEISDQGQFSIKPKLQVDTLSGSHAQGYGEKLFENKVIAVGVKDQVEKQIKTESSCQGGKPQFGVDTISASNAGYGANLFKDKDAGFGVKNQAESQLKQEVSTHEGLFVSEPQLGFENPNSYSLPSGIAKTDSNPTGQYSIHTTEIPVPVVLTQQGQKLQSTDTLSHTTTVFGQESTGMLESHSADYQKSKISSPSSSLFSGNSQPSAKDQLVQTTDFTVKPFGSSQITESGFSQTQFDQKLQESGTLSQSSTTLGEKPLDTVQTGSGYEHTQIGLVVSQNQQSYPSDTFSSSSTSKDQFGHTTQFNLKSSDSSQTKGSNCLQSQLGGISGSQVGQSSQINSAEYEKSKSSQVDQTNQKPKTVAMLSTQHSSSQSQDSSNIFFPEDIGSNFNQKSQETQFGGVSGSQFAVKSQTTNTLSQSSTFGQKPFDVSQSSTTYEKTQIGSLLSEKDQSIQSGSFSNVDKTKLFEEKPFVSSLNSGSSYSHKTQFSSSSESQNTQPQPGAGNVSTTIPQVVPISQYGNKSFSIQSNEKTQFGSLPGSFPAETSKATQSSSLSSSDAIKSQSGLTTQFSGSTISSESSFSQTNLGITSESLSNQKSQSGVDSISQVTPISQYGKKPFGTQTTGSHYEETQFGSSTDSFSLPSGAPKVQSAQVTQFEVKSFSSSQTGSSLPQNQLSGTFGSQSSQGLLQNTQHGSYGGNYAGQVQKQNAPAVSQIDAQKPFGSYQTGYQQTQLAGTKKESSTQNSALVISQSFAQKTQNSQSNAQHNIPSVGFLYTPHSVFDQGVSEFGKVASAFHTAYSGGDRTSVFRGPKEVFVVTRDPPRYDVKTGYHY